MDNSPADIETTCSQEFSASVTSRTKYKFTPLNEANSEIRLLQLLPSSISMEIRASLTITRLTNDYVPDYEALSYVWGSPEDLTEIFIGTEGSQTLSVTQNLAEALPYLRCSKKQRTLWIDAACVNQRDLKERSSQVKRMADIYSKARKVLVWLGKESQDSALGLECVRTLSAKIELDHATTAMIPLSDEPSWTDWKSKLPFDAEQSTAVARLCNRDWFKRLWIWQEVRCAKNVEIICGTDSISWRDVQVLGFCCLRKSWHDSFYHTMSRLHRRLIFSLCGVLQSNSFFALVDQTKYSLCSDPRDRIFALISMATERDIRVESDYEKTVPEVYTTFVMDYIKHHEDLNVLTKVGSRKVSEKSLPSWVPDFSVPQVTSPLNKTHASGFSTSQFGFGNEMSLEVEGTVVSTIISNEPCRLDSAGEFTSDDMRAELSRMVRTMQQRGDVEWNLQQVHNLCQALFSGDFADNYFPSLTKADIVTASQLEDIVQSFLMLASDTSETQATLTVAESLVVDSISHYLLDRSILVSSTGSISLGPQAAQKGDVTAVLLGCDSPMILRPVGLGKHLVVGEAFCDGIMYGESILGPFPEGFRPVWRYNDEKESYLVSFLRCDSGELQNEDPRLDGIPLPLGCGKKDAKLKDEKHRLVSAEIGEQLMLRDPRLNLEFLKARGVETKTLTLI
ncbi:heterokaryon incompatibility protein-domain-containing protein [Rhexocercosporidium sp. MPI-PUGE-AT-0058]|nr:heterokaryon incompatibility protein-domain-containing protein [Rhexocercosporidium sp. MPI-PUGE-AT-0058]